MENTQTLTDLTAILTWLAGPAGTAAWMIYVSSWFKNATTEREDGTKLIDLTSWQLQLAVFVASVLPPIIAYAIRALVPTETLAAIAPIYSFVAILFLAYLGQQGYFLITKSASKTTVTVSAPIPKPDASGEATTGAISVNVGESSISSQPTAGAAFSPPVAQSNQADLSVG